MPVPINAGVEFDLTFSRLPVTIRSVCKNLDESLDRLAKGSSLAVTTFLFPVLQTKSSDTRRRRSPRTR